MSDAARKKEHTVDSRGLEKALYWMVLLFGIGVIGFNSGVYYKIFAELAKALAISLPWFVCWLLAINACCGMQYLIIRPIILWHDRELGRSLLTARQSTVDVLPDDSPGMRAFKAIHNRAPFKALGTAKIIAWFVFGLDIALAIGGLPPISASPEIILATGRGIEWANLFLILMVTLSIPGITHVLLHLSEIAYHHQPKKAQ